MALFLVPIVRQGKQSLWRDWANGAVTDEISAALRQGDLGQEIQIKARNKQEAAIDAERQRPGFVAIRESILRLGR